MIAFDFDKVRAAALAARESAPGEFCAYVYDLGALSRHTRAIREALPRECDFYYAVKANSDLPLLRAIAPHTDGFETSSAGEIAWVREHFPDAPLLISGPGKTDSELLAALRSEVTVHVESEYEIVRLASLARTSDLRGKVLLRVNPPLGPEFASTLMMGGKPTQFGVSPEAVGACLARLAGAPELSFLGFHFHLLSHQHDARAHLELIAHCRDFAMRAALEHGVEVEHVNVGGGIGVNYRDTGAAYDLRGFGEGLREILRTPGPRLRFEFGRYVSAYCGAYATEVIDVKLSGDRAFAIVNGGTHHFRTPAAQGHSHPFTVVPVAEWDRPYPRPGADTRALTVAGRLCTPKDTLARDADPGGPVRAGDLLLFSHAGAYAWHISHHDFLRHAHPLHLFVP